MQPTVYQKPEIRDANDNIIQQGAFGKNTALANATNDGWIDYVANDLEFLYDLAKDEIVPVPSLPASGQMNKTYLLTTTGVSYRWSGTQWVAVSSSEAVGRAESAALLAEQWATKTDGTVDGTEYSAKYYAEQAEASADDAQDTADDMADHLVQIDKNTGGVAKNSKRISNIEKLLQGNLYDYDTDDDSAYTKTVPSGALPYAGIEQIGGKTVVWNQKWVDTMARAATFNGITETKTDNGLTATGTPTVTNNQWLWSFTCVSGHKYFIGGCPVHEGVLLTCYYASAYIQQSNGFIIAPTTSNGIVYVAIQTPTLGTEINIAWTPMLIDLTLMFGSGNEPSTVEEFEAMFPADYYEYNAGTLLSAGVTEVESKGKNLLYIQSASTSNTVDGVTVSYDADTKTITYSGTNTNATSHKVLSVTTVDANLEVGKTYTISTTNQIPSNTYINVMYKDKNNSSKTLQYFTTNNETFTVPADYNSFFAIQLSVKASATTIPTTSFQIQIEEGSTATAYSPYKEISMPIPAEVRALEGYGWSAGSVYNYIDFERKVYVQNVGRVDMGTLTWQSASYTPYYFQTTLTDKKDGLAKLICPKYVVYGSGVASIQGSIGIAQSTNNVKAVYVVDSAHDGETGATFKSAMSGVYLYYELATPVETDISQYLTDNLIEVGAGGTITFPNANGDNYHIPVPSTETYMIDLQSAIGE